LLVARAKPSEAVLRCAASKAMGSCTSWPKRPAQPKPRPISTPDLDALDRLHAHDGGGDAGVEPVAPVHGAAEAGGAVEDVDLDDAADGGLVDLGLVDRLLLGRGGGGVGAVGVAGVAGGDERTPVVRGDLDAGGGLVDGADEAERVDPQFAQEALGQCAGGDAGGGLARAGTLEGLAAVGGEVLDAAGEVGVAGARRVDGGRLVVVVEARVAVGDLQRDGGADGVALADAGEEGRGVGLDVLPPAAPVPALAPRELGVDGCQIDGHAGGEAADDREQGGAVRLAGGGVGQ